MEMRAELRYPAAAMILQLAVSNALKQHHQVIVS